MPMLGKEDQKRQARLSGTGVIQDEKDEKQ